MPEPHLEYIRCNLCGADETTVLFEAPTPARYGRIYHRASWPIVRCRRCGLIYVNPRLDTASLRAFYDFENPADRTFVQEWFVEGADLQQATWQRYARTIHRYCPSGRLLDVGCGAGSFLAEMQKLGYDVAGQDISPFFLDICRTRYGIQVYGGDLETLALEPGSFDCITAFDIIEHHPDPKQLLGTIHRLVRPGGLTVIGTHDIGNLFARLYGVHWRHIHPIAHLTYFTRTTLAAMMEACGFRIIRRGGLHTMDASRIAEMRNWVIQSWKALALRALILGLYRPLATRAPALTHWRLRWGASYLDHRRLLARASSQIIMNDDMIFLAVT